MGSRLFRIAAAAVVLVLFVAVGSGVGQVLGPLGPPQSGYGFSSWVDVSSREASRQFFLEYYLYAPAPAIEWTGTRSPCVAGTTSQAFRDSVLLRINFYRAMAGVPSQVVFDETYNAKAQQSALMMSAQGSLSHSPPATWACYTADGAQAAGSSNLALGTYGTSSITAYIKDSGSNNTAAGHRRWILYPQTQNMGTGDIPSTGGWAANDLWVFDSHMWETRPATRESFVAWPPPGYVPYQVVFPRWSFSYAGATFTNATVTMTQGGTPVSVAQEVVANGYGENTVVWIPGGMSHSAAWPRPDVDTPYLVTVSNVIVNGTPQTFSYTVTVIDPGTKVTPVVTWSDPAPIASGTPLSGTQLNATADVPGTFVYTPAAGTVLSAGLSTLSVTFTPDNTTLYETVTHTVSLEVFEPVDVTELIADRASPVAPGTVVTWTATATGGTAPLQYQFWLYSPGSGWSVLQSYSPSASVSWEPASAGSYTVQVWVRSAGSTATYDDWRNSMNLVVSSPLTVSSITANRTSPVAPGTTVTWTASATGGTAPLQYQFWLYSPSSGWSLLQAYSTSNTVSWVPASAGTYTVQAWVRSAGSTATYDAWKNSTAMAVTSPLVVTSVTPDPTSPVGVGTPVTWTAAASGGTAPLQYQFWVYSSATGWSLLQAYGTSATAAWVPASAGTYTVQVWVRSAGSTATYDAWHNSVPIIVQ